MAAEAICLPTKSNGSRNSISRRGRCTGDKGHWAVLLGTITEQTNCSSDTDGYDDGHK